MTAREIRWRSAWPLREARHRWRRHRGTTRLDRETIAHVFDVPIYLLAPEEGSLWTSVVDDTLPAARQPDESEAR